MKPLLLLACVMLVSAACGGNDKKFNLLAPSSASVSALSTDAIRGAIPFHILHPLEFDMVQDLISFPPRNEVYLFFQNLQALYRDVLRRPQTGTSVDAEGQTVWLSEYFRFLVNGCTHEVASSRTLTEIATGVAMPSCRSASVSFFPPRNLVNEFQNQLEATYRDVLRRPQTLSYVDSEGTTVWIGEYLLRRVIGCDHASAESEVFTEVRGGRVGSECGDSWGY
jgi:hypothetical protein